MTYSTQMIDISRQCVISARKEAIYTWGERDRHGRVWRVQERKHLSPGSGEGRDWAIAVSAMLIGFLGRGPVHRVSNVQTGEYV